MDDRHLGERVHHDEAEADARDVRENDTRASLADGHAAAEEQPGADRTAHGDHRHVSPRQLPLEAMFALDQLIGPGGHGSWSR